MSSNYQRSYEILWERRKRPSLAYPNGCEAELDAEQEKHGP